ncbi:hypothetical protein PR202_gb29580 [Eleusine coracana subsp. coracana]|uniref:Uncharacterized protein n=1 Tax=Eleusine coracana subsp. coracana TaxID=191504 RepID=A0AAV5FZZ9_ELECO|nr:hypothetical protein PR202_gb29580 [Eleusine coracana subsp. coracana]
MDVAKAIQARRQEKTRSCDETVDDRRRRLPGHASAAGGQELESTDPASAPERKRLEKDRHHRSGGRGRHWQPSLKSISEFPS